MAHAARLNLRMQKELKLLLTDPPPGASFPDLSPTSDLTSFSLAAIDAQIEGPEGTVYEKGVFKIKIQIPERYPFQPPIVTFGTPIYHPNIDTGGRICLDILNLPPKGAWQPSLNISTVLTSIGLLLSEPNPDDGLMCEASREYKYNKQVFEQKARSMTEKYARSGASPNHGGVQLVTDPIMREDKPPEPVKKDLDEYAVSFRKHSGTGRKLSLDASCSGSNTRESDMGNNEITSITLCQSRIQEPKHDSEVMSFEHGKNHVLTVMSTDHDQYNKPPAISSKKLCISSKNLQHGILGSARESDMRRNEITSSSLCQSRIQEPKQDSEDMSFEHGKKHVLPVMSTDHDQYNKPPAISSKKLCLSSKNLQHEILVSTRESDMRRNEITSSTLCQSRIQEPKQDSHDMSFEYGKNHVLTMMSTDHDQYNKPPAISSKKLGLSSKNLQHEILGSTRECDMRRNEITSSTLSQSRIQEPKQDSEDISFEHGKNRALTVISTDHDQYNKPPAISSKRLCLSSKNLQHEILDSTVLHDLDAQKENLLRVQKKPIVGTGCTNLKRKKLGLTGKKPSLGFLAIPHNRKTDDKVQAGGKGAIPTPVIKLPRKPFQVLEKNRNRDMNLRAHSEILDTNVSNNGARFDEETSEQEGLCDSGVIVLDSEDSEEEEKGASKSRRLIARKHFGKAVHVCEATLTKRLIEYENTEAESLTIEEFMQNAMDFQNEMQSCKQFANELKKHEIT
ncbi:hypothetical protein SSX86_021464 [Deinandra increscens subsp. villosa]|uniref:E2 ubiquitin-conjugating enzyme n=1 Tax=Deinandra increscens subsp. villosa TaxID=3103831 RepID=A0AAP0CWV1_9ASTR